ncbi:MAG: hypothetical protein HQM16_02510 [Deltaproteobacteria bacterium]|nr:hypothetical protein [Deltaproteobacteria bacterium]
MSFPAVNNLHQALAQSPFAGAVALNTRLPTDLLYDFGTLRQLAVILSGQDKVLAAEVKAVTAIPHRKNTPRFDRQWSDCVSLIAGRQSARRQQPETGEQTALTGNTLIEAVQRQLDDRTTRQEWISRALARVGAKQRTKEVVLAHIEPVNNLRLQLGPVSNRDYRVQLNEQGELVVVTMECPSSLRVFSMPIVEHLLGMGLRAYFFTPPAPASPLFTKVSAADIEGIHSVDQEVELNAELIRALQTAGFNKLSQDAVKKLRERKGLDPQTLIDIAFEVSETHKHTGLQLLSTALKAKIQDNHKSLYASWKLFCNQLISMDSKEKGKPVPVSMEDLQETILLTSIENPDRRKWFEDGLKSLGVPNPKAILDEKPIDLDKRKAVYIKISRTPGNAFHLDLDAPVGASSMLLNIGVPRSVTHLSKDNIKLLVALAIVKEAFGDYNSDNLIAETVTLQSLSSPKDLLKPLASMTLSADSYRRISADSLSREQQKELQAVIHMFKALTSVAAQQHAKESEGSVFRTEKRSHEKIIAGVADKLEPLFAIPHAEHFFKALSKCHIADFNIAITVDDTIEGPVVSARAMAKKITFFIKCAHKDIPQINAQTLIALVLRFFDRGLASSNKLFDPPTEPDSIMALAALEVLQEFLVSPNTPPERLAVTGSDETKPVRQALGHAMMALHDFSKRTDNPLLGHLSTNMLSAQRYHVQVLTTTDDTTTITALPTDRGVFIQIKGKQQNINAKQWLYLLTVLADNPGKAVCICIRGNDISIVFGTHKAGRDLYASIISDVRLLRFGVFDPAAKRPQVSPKFPGDKAADAHPNFMQSPLALRRAYIKALIWFAYAQIPDELKPTATDTPNEIKQKKKAMSFAYHPDRLGQQYRGAELAEKAELFKTANTHWDTIEAMNNVNTQFNTPTDA